MLQFTLCTRRVRLKLGGGWPPREIRGRKMSRAEKLQIAHRGKGILWEKNNLRFLFFSAKAKELRRTVGFVFGAGVAVGVAVR